MEEPGDRPPALRIELTKLDDERHRLAIRRADGSAESVELETRSCLLHDLVHYALEAEAGFTSAFWGTLARGTTLAALSGGAMTGAPSAELMLAERLVGPMQSLWKGQLDPALYVENVGKVAPGLVDEAFVARVSERLRSLWGRWRATPYRGVMELLWPPVEPGTAPTASRSRGS